MRHIGREIESSSEFSIDRIAQVLRGARAYDALGTEEQAVVRAHWAEKMTALTVALRLDQNFAQQKRPYVELDDSGRVVRQEPGQKP